MVGDQLQLSPAILSTGSVFCTIIHSSVTGICKKKLQKNQHTFGAGNIMTMWRRNP